MKIDRRNISAICNSWLIMISKIIVAVLIKFVIFLYSNSLSTDQSLNAMIYLILHGWNVISTNCCCIESTCVLVYNLLKRNVCAFAVYSLDSLLRQNYAPPLLLTFQSFKVRSLLKST